jgi:1,4-alpha-glucan branching enzyme
MILPSNERIERVPAWIKRVTQDLSKSPTYDARFWNPSPKDRYTFKHPHPPKPSDIRVYEAHVGISTTQERVGTYKEFTRDVLERIKDLGYNTIQLMAIMEHAYYACKHSGHSRMRWHEVTRISIAQLSGIKLPTSSPQVPDTELPRNSRN